MAITPGLKFEPPYVGSYNQEGSWGGQGEGARVVDPKRS